MFGIEMPPTQTAVLESGVGDEERALKRFFIDRLNRLAESRVRLGDSLSPSDKRLLDFAMYSVYWDCVDLGQRVEARQVLGFADSKAE
jgi:hypothetical protein